MGIIEFYALMGLIMLIIGVIRFQIGKQAEEPDALDVFSWFIGWPVYLTLLLIKGYKKLRKQFQKI